LSLGLGYPRNVVSGFKRPVTDRVRHLQVIVGIIKRQRPRNDMLNLKKLAYLDFLPAQIAAPIFLDEDTDAASLGH
jgi:hypothetical protein